MVDMLMEELKLVQLNKDYVDRWSGKLTDNHKP